MEDKNVDHSSSVGGGSAGSSSPGSSCRWNPTKEQINMLEGLYRQGIRTPSADQIQHITARLKVYGHIEGKNVFYWFQNHKARQRQKQKQENMIYLNRFLHHKPSLPLYAPPHPCNNVMCNPFYIPSHTSDINGYYQQYQTKVAIPAASSGGVLSRRPRVDYKVPLQEKKRLSDDSAGFEAVMNYRLDGMHAGGDFNEEKNFIINTPTTNTNISNPRSSDDHETLALFPLHPTGVLEGNNHYYSTSGNYYYSHPSSLSSSSTSAENNNNNNSNSNLTNNSSSDQSCIEEMISTTTTTTSMSSDHHLYFDFFADQQHHYFQR